MAEITIEQCDNGYIVKAKRVEKKHHTAITVENKWVVQIAGKEDLINAVEVAFKWKQEFYKKNAEK